MKELEDIWNKPGNGKDDDLSRMLDMGTIKGLNGQDTIKKLRAKLVVNMGFGLVAALIYAYITWMNPAWPLVIAMGTVILFTLAGIWHTGMLYRQLGRYRIDQPLLTALIEQRDLIREWMRQQHQAAYLYYPICAVGGFMLGASVGAAKPITVIMSDLRLVTIMLITAALIVWPALKIGKWLTKKAFGGHLREIEQHIEALQYE